MFFLLRMVFWLGVVCVLLPSGGSKPASPEAQINATQAVTLASAAVSDMRGFCDRQPDACKAGSNVAVAIGHKAEAGARTLYQLVATKVREASAAQKTASQKTTGQAIVTVSTVEHETLTPSDLGAGLADAGSAAAAPRGAGRPAFRLNACFFEYFAAGSGRGGPPRSHLAIGGCAAYISG